MTKLSFRNDEEFHRAALHMGFFAGVFLFGSYALTRLSNPTPSLLSPFALFAVVLGTVLGAAPKPVRAKGRELVTMVAGAAACGLVVFLSGTSYLWLSTSVFAVLTGALMARGLSGQRFLVTCLTGAIFAVAALHVLATTALALTHLGLPTFCIALVTGGCFGLVCVMGLVPRHLHVTVDRVAEAHEAVKDKLHGEVRELCERAIALWPQVDASLESSPQLRNTVEESFLRLFDVGKTWQAVGGDATPTHAEPLTRRIQALDEKIAATKDPIARGQYQDAKTALAEQLRYLIEIATSRERVVARMHHYLAAMERLRFALIKHRSADASRLSGEVEPILNSLADVGKELDFTSEAIGEVEKESLASHEPLAAN